MKELLQRVAAFLWHVIDAPETSEETRAVAEELVDDVVKAINERLADDGTGESPRE